LGFFSEMLKTLSIGRLLKQVREFFIAALTGMFRIQ
jgi:hypothetical protein